MTGGSDRRYRYMQMDDKTTKVTPEAMNINRAGSDDRATTWNELGESLLNLATQRRIDHVKVLTAFFGNGAGIDEAVKRIGNALYNRSDKQHILFLADTESTNEHWDPRTLYVNIVVNPGIGDDDADNIYAAVLEEIVLATVVDKPCKLRWHRNDTIADRIMAGLAGPTGVSSGPAT